MSCNHLSDCQRCGAEFEELEAQRDELLEALCYLLQTSTGESHDQWLQAMDQARAAILKAKGESNE